MIDKFILSGRIRNIYRKILTNYFLRLFFGKIGKNCIVFKQFRLINPQFIYLKDNVVLLGNSRIELISKYGEVLFYPRLILGNNSQIHQNCHITCAKNIEIGDDVIIVANVTITDIIHPYNEPFIPINKTRIIVKPVKIGNQTYIYNNAVILPGVEIGKHCIIGANSVVNTNIPDYSVAVGNPAKVIKQYNFETKKWEKV
jgi:bifunctional N-acetylglucosamine-1-phosphate-uridyltransferase/glucosamine-1-phosphate-acetyltransferase GlmU-like protein